MGRIGVGLGIPSGARQRWSPLRDSGVVCFLDADRSRVLTAGGADATDGGAVDRVTDLSPHGNDAVAYDANHRSLLGTTSFNGQRGIRMGYSPLNAHSGLFTVGPFTNVRSAFIEFLPTDPVTLTAQGVAYMTPFGDNGSTHFDFTGVLNSTYTWFDPANTPLIAAGHVWQNGALATNTNALKPLDQMVIVTSANAYVGNIGADRVALTADARILSGVVRRVILSTSVWDAAFVARLTSWVNSRTVAKWTVLAIGNSITSGYGLLAGQDYPSQTVSLLPGGVGAYTLNNEGVGGETTTQEITKSNNGTYRPFVGGKTLVLCSEVTNDMYFDVLGAGAQAASVYVDHYRSLVQSLSPLDRVVTTTVLPRSDVSMTAPQIASLYALRAQVNPLIRADALLSRYLADWAADPVMGPDGAEASTTNYQDRTHPTAIGAGLLAAITARAAVTAMATP